MHRRRRELLWGLIGLILGPAGCGLDPADSALHRPTIDDDQELIAAAPDDDLTGLQGLECWSGTECAAYGPYLGDTCCTYGDSLIERAHAPWPDAMEVKVDGSDLVTCGMRGAAWAQLDDNATTLELRPFPEGARCQHAALGPRGEDGSRIVWLTHVGDNSAPTTPRLGAYRLDPSGSISPIQEITGGDFLDLAVSDGRVYVATGREGVEVYDIGPEGDLTFDRSIGPLAAAETVAIADGFLYIGHRNATLSSIDISDPSVPFTTSTTGLGGRPRLVRPVAHRLGIALGIDGLQILDASDPGAPVEITTMKLAGSVQGIAGEGDRIAAATWHGATLVDADTLTIAGTQRHANPHGRTLAVAWAQGLLYTADREGISVAEFRPGFVAANAELTPGSCFIETGSSGQITIRNHGPMNLVMHEVVVPNASFTVGVPSIDILPGESVAFGVAHSGTGPGGLLTLSTNDPEPNGVPLNVEEYPPLGLVLEGFEEGEVHLLYPLDLRTALPARVLMDLRALDATVWGLHDGAATAHDFAARIGAESVVHRIDGVLDEISFPAGFGGPRFVVLDKYATVRAVRPHYDPEELSRLVSDLLDE